MACVRLDAHNTIAIMVKIEGPLRACAPILGLVVLILMVFSPTIYFEFLNWDDHLNIVNNPHLQAPSWQWPEITWILSFNTSLRFMPVTWLAHMAICDVSGMSAAAYHLGLLVLHLINSLLVYHLALRILCRFASDQVPREAIAFTTSAFWAVNGLRVEVLGWCTALPYPLATLFALGSFHYYLNSMSGDGLKFRPYLWSFILNGLSVCAYPISLGYAFCLPFFDGLFFREQVSHRWHPRSVEFGAYWVSRTLFTLPSIAILMATIHARLHPTGEFASSTVPTQAGIIVRMVHGVYAWAYIYSHQFWPFDLTPVHYPWTDLGFHWIYWPVLLCLIGLVSIAWWKKSFTTLAILAISMGLAAPMLGLTEDPATPVDRFSYLPNAFFSLLLAWGASRCWYRRPTLRASWMVMGSGLACCAMLGLQSHHQLRIWKNSPALFARLETSPETKARPDIQEHIQHLEATEAAQLLLGGHLTKALEIYDELTQFKPENYVYWHQRGLTLHLLGRDGEALQSLHVAYSLGQNPMTLQLIQSINTATLPAKP
jgi:hypothetical protein